MEKPNGACPHEWLQSDLWSSNDVQDLQALWVQHEKAFADILEKFAERIYKLTGNAAEAEKESKKLGDFITKVYIPDAKLRFNTKGQKPVKNNK